jgi:16S rRNA (adenine1518-N6/adenine1519-N6)-dimethyltransferase
VVRLAEVVADDKVIEVGAGFGTLTLGLAAAASSVIAIELDRRLIPALREVVEGCPNVSVVEADAMSMDYSSLARTSPHRFIANLPYNIATPLIATLLEGAPAITDFVVMIQREVGERLAARPGSKSYGGISVLVTYHCRTAILGKVPPTVFWPAPKVESLLIRLERRPPIVGVGSAELMPVVRAAFSQRRKTVRNSLVAGLGQQADRVEEALRQAGVPPSARAESLGLEEFALIVEALR